LRPGELFALTNDDIVDNRIHVSKRLYRGHTDVPKSNKARTVVLVPAARDALDSLPESQGTVFLSKTGQRMSQATLTNYWNQVKARAGVDVGFYLSTRHFCAHHFKVARGLPNHVLAVQFGWSEAMVEKMVATYAHADVGALEAIDRAFADAAPMQPAGIPLP
jgi:integrase